MIGDHYVVNKSHSHFIYIALELTVGFALTRKFLHEYIFLKYPDIEVRIKGSTFNYFKNFIFRPIDEHRKKEIEMMNVKRNIYRQIDIRQNHETIHQKSVQEFRNQRLETYYNVKYGTE
jgi:hypothetical protein